MSAGGKDSGKPVILAPTGIKKISKDLPKKVADDKDTDNNGEPNTPKTSKSSKDSTATALTKDVPKKIVPPTKKDSGKNVAVKKGPLTKEDKEDADDPIAQAMRLREKAGGVTSQVSAADAKKAGAGAGVTAKIEPKAEPKATKPATMDKKNVPEEDKKQQPAKKSTGAKE